MAIVFISPKQRQKMFFTGITILFLLLLLIISLVVFLSKPPKPPEDQIVFNRPKIDINLNVLDQEQVKILEPPVQMDLQFKYTAMTNTGAKTSGIVTAVSKDDAQKILQGMQLTGIDLEESISGRENPFIPYYQQTVVPPAPVTPTKPKK